MLVLVSKYHSLSPIYSDFRWKFVICRTFLCSNYFLDLAVLDVVKEWKFQFLLAKLVFIRFVSLLYRVVSISKRLKIVNNSRFFFFSWIWPCHSIDFDPISAWRFNGATFSIGFDSRDQLLLETFRFWRSTSPFLRGSLFPRTYVFHPCIYSGRICKGRWESRRNLQQYLQQYYVLSIAFLKNLGEILRFTSRFQIFQHQNRELNTLQNDIIGTRFNSRTSIGARLVSRVLSTNTRITFRSFKQSAQFTRERTLRVETFLRHLDYLAGVLTEGVNTRQTNDGIKRRAREVNYELRHSCWYQRHSRVAGCPAANSSTSQHHEDPWERLVCPRVSSTPCACVRACK